MRAEPFEPGLDLLARGMTPQQALDFMVRGDEGRENRQVAILDMQGRSAAWTGKNPRDWKGHRCTPDYCVQGNIIAGPEVLDGMVAASVSTTNINGTSKVRNRARSSSGGQCGH